TLFRSELASDDSELARTTLHNGEIVQWVREVEAARSPRWVIRSARELYPRLLQAGVLLARVHDLVLCHAILRDTDAVARPLAPTEHWMPRPLDDAPPALFDVGDDGTADPVAELLEQYREQRRVIASDGSGC